MAIGLVLGAALLTIVAPAAPAQDTSRAERAAERAEQRVERARERAEERAERIRERAERRGDWQFEAGNGAHILVGRDYSLPEGSTADEGIVVVGGDARIDGTAQNNVVVVGGTLTLGPKAVIHGDVATVGGELIADPAALIEGEVNTVHIGWPQWSWAGWPIGLGNRWWAGAAAAFTIGRLVVVLFLSVILLAVAPGWINSIAARLVAAPGLSTVLGFVGEMLFAPAMIALAVALVITIIGIPLLVTLPLLAAGFGIMWVAGYAAVTGLIGARLRGADWRFGGLTPLDLVIGSLVVSGITVIGQLMMMASGWMVPLAIAVRGTGWVVEYVAWTAALGAALGAWRRGTDHGPGFAPPVPPLPTPAPSSM